MDQKKFLLAELLSMDLDERIKTIKFDVESGRDEFKIIDPIELAEALCVPLNAVNGVSPDDWYLWATYFYFEIPPISDLLNRSWTIIELIWLIEDFVPKDRYEYLIHCFNQGNVNSEYEKVLTTEECNLISRTHAKNCLNDEDGCYYSALATYCLESSDGISLFFEALLDGDYRTLNELNTPYDDRDGKFLDVENDDKYVSRFIN